MQVDSNQVASWLQGVAVTCRDGLEPLHSYDGIMGWYPSQNTEFGKSSALLVIVCVSSDVLEQSNTEGTSQTKWLGKKGL